MPDLATLANLKSYLGITDGSQDTELQRLLTAKSAAFMNAIHRQDFAPAAAFTDRLYGNGCHEIFLKHYPINSITSVTIDGTAQTVSADGIADGYYFDASLPPEDRQKLSIIGACFPFCGWRSSRGWSSTPNVVVVYNAGYTTIPVEVSQAVIEWVAFARGAGQLQAADQSGVSEQIGDYSHGAIASETSKYLASAIPQSVQDVIDSYDKPGI